MNYSRPLGNASTGNVRIVGSDSALREFLVYHLGTTSLDDTEITVYIGQLPAESPALEIPIPTEARVIGSIVHKDRTEIYLIAGSTPEASLASYEQILIADGWRFVEDLSFTARAGFIDKPGEASRVYCQETAKISLTVGLSKAEQGTSIRLLATRQPKPCVSFSQMIATYRNDEVMPQIQKPPGTTLIGGGVGGGSSSAGSHYYSSAKLLAKLSTREIVEHYHNQLAALSWEKQNETISDKSALSTWLFSQEGRSWIAYFILSANPSADDEYMLWLNLFEQDQ